MGVGKREGVKQAQGDDPAVKPLRADVPQAGSAVPGAESSGEGVLVDRERSQAGSWGGGLSSA